VARRLYQRALGFARGLRTPLGARPTAHEVVDQPDSDVGEPQGWHDAEVAQRQDAAYADVLSAMYAGQPRRDLLVAADALRRTGIAAPSVLEVGCASGYYGEALAHLLGGAVTYTGLDLAWPMVELARRKYPERCFLVGDAVALPLRDGAFDVVISGVSLMHVLRYEVAIAESRRVSRGWSIFHTVPVVRKRATTTLRHRAYGRSYIELLFNEDELRAAFGRCGLVVRHEAESIPYDLSATVGVPTAAKTYLCQAA
jgi:ubiquinone/menaquinone biosynthesis C-methylase UbiE